MYPFMYTGASGLVADQKTLDLVANNLANVRTTAYTPERPLFASYLSQAGASAQPGGQASSPLGVMIAGAWRESGPGPMRETGNPFDMALDGAGWFRVATAGGERLTRAGSFTRTADGLLATPLGQSVLDDQGRPIRLPEGQLSVAEDGTLTIVGDPALGAGGETLGRIGLVEADPKDLERDGESLWRPKRAVREAEPGSVRVRQGYLEDSKVNAMEELIEMISAQRLFEMHQKIVDQAGNTIARRSLELANTR